MKCQSYKVKGYIYEQNGSSLEVLQVGLTLVGGCNGYGYWKLHVNNEGQWGVQEIIWIFFPRFSLALNSINATLISLSIPNFSLLLHLLSYKYT